MTETNPNIQTRSSNYFYFKNPQQSRYSIFDVAGALSKICRFGGHCREFYSVAEHSIYTGQVVEYNLATSIDQMTDDDWGLVLEAHLHDGPEAFISDVCSPLKRELADYMMIEKEVERDFFPRFGLSPQLSYATKHADLVMLKTEQEQLMPDRGEKWPILKGIESAKIVLKCMSPKEAEHAFLERFFFLAGKLNLNY